MMSAPNKNYDPVEVTALTADEVARAVAEALAAIEGLNGRDHDGRNLTVNEAKPREARTGGGGGYGGGRSGGGRDRY
jgi:hypothetical protein